MKSDEVFKIIEDHPNYMVSNKGRVLNTKRSRYLKPSPNNKGYLQVGLYSNGDAQVKCKVHILVAKAFIPNPLNLETVNHIDEVKDNNYDSNLEWMTRGDNTIYSKAGDFIFINPEGLEVEVFNLNQFCRDNNLLASKMCLLNQGKRNQHKGWTRCL